MGGTVDWISKGRRIYYKKGVEEKEESGTPLIIQVIRAGFSMKLKAEIGADILMERENAVFKRISAVLNENSNIVIYERDKTENRLPIIPINFLNMNYKEAVYKLSKIHNIQVRGGCCCANIYSHKLLKISNAESENIFRQLQEGKRSNKNYGFVRISLSPFITDKEIDEIAKGVGEISVL